MGFLTKSAAVLAGKEALSKLNIKRGWKISVNNNLGWYVRLCNKYIQLNIDNYHDGVSYWSMIDSDCRAMGGECYWTPHDILHSKNPNKAIAAAVSHLNAFMKHATICQSHVNSLVKGKR